MNQDRIQREKDFHNKRFADDNRAVVSKYYKATYESKQRFNELIDRHLGKKDEHILEYGCGVGGRAYQLAESGVQVTGIDISEVAIEKAKESAREHGVDIDYRVMNAEELNFENENFNLVFGSGILHHLDIDKAYSEIARVLKSDGEAIFFEPLGHNSLINAYRNSTPEMRSDDEHPLLMHELEKLEEFFDEVDIEHFGLTSIAGALFSPLTKPLQLLDKGLFSVFPFIKKYSWIVVIRVTKPSVT